MRLNRRLFPEVWPSHADKGYGFGDLDDKYADMDKVPLMVTGNLMTGYVPSDPDGTAHLDAILAAAVLTAHPCPVRYPEKGVALIPLPLDMLWQSEAGFPLWAASDFHPANICNSQEYWHKRYPTHRANIGSKMNANTASGRWREYRVPINSVAPTRLKAVCMGNHDEVKRLLAYITHVGKKGSLGYGRVQWDVEQMPGLDILPLIHSGKLLPAGYAATANISGAVKPARGWTPPYWYAPHHSICIDASC